MFCWNHCQSIGTAALFRDRAFLDGFHDQKSVAMEPRQLPALRAEVARAVAKERRPFHLLFFSSSETRPNAAQIRLMVSTPVPCGKTAHRGSGACYTADLAPDLWQLWEVEDVVCIVGSSAAV